MYVKTEDGKPLEVELSGGYPAGATPFSAAATSTANTEATATVAAGGEGKCHYVMGYMVALRAAAASNDALVTVKDGTTVKITDVIGNAAVVGTRVGIAGGAVPILKGTANTALNVVAGAAGASAITEINVWGYTL